MKSIIECAGGYGVGAANHIPHLPKPNIINHNVDKRNHATRQRQQVVKMGKIDEDQPCHFENNNQIGLKTNILYIRKRASVVKKPPVDLDLC